MSVSVTLGVQEFTAADSAWFHVEVTIPVKRLTWYSSWVHIQIVETAVSVKVFTAGYLAWVHGGVTMEAISFVQVFTVRDPVWVHDCE